MSAAESSEKTFAVRPLPLAALAVAFAAGIVFSSYSAFPFELFAAVSLILLFVFFVTRNRPFVLLTIVFFTLGGARFTANAVFSPQNRVSNLIDSGEITSGDPAIIEGTIASLPEGEENAMRLRLRARLIEVNHLKRETYGDIRVRVDLPAGPADDRAETIFPVGTRVSVACRLIREEEFQNPGVRPRLAILSADGFDAICNVKSPDLIEILAVPIVPRPIEIAGKLRNYIISGFRRLLDPQTAGVMIAAITGNKNFLDKQTAETFREGGTFHILVISGLHITLIAGILLWITGFFTQNRLFHLAFVGGFVWLFALVVGGDVPVVRAAIMMTIFLSGRAIYRSGSGLNSLALAVILLLLWRPGDLFEASFQLTAVSVGAIVIIAMPLLTKLRKIGEWEPAESTPFPPNVSPLLRRFAESVYWNETAWEIRNSQQVWHARLIKRPFRAAMRLARLRKAFVWLFEAMLVSLIVQAAMLPLSIWYFHRWMPMGFLLNLWVAPILALETFTAFAALIANIFNQSVAAGFALIAEALNSLMMLAPHAFSAAGLTGGRVPIYAGITRMLYWLYFVPIVIAAAAVRKWNPFSLGPRRHSRFYFGTALIAANAFFAGVLVIHPFSNTVPDGRLHIDFLDVGQGDAAFITLPDGKTMLIDGGGRLDFRENPVSINKREPDLMTIGESVVSEFLWERGISRIDYLVATHSDTDHFQGLIDAARNFSIGEFWTSRQVIENAAFSPIAELSERRGFAIRPIKKGDLIETSGCRIEVLWPPAETLSGLSDNDSSLIIRIIYGQRRFLFTGDAERAAEESVLGSAADMRADVVKVPHHGSRTSSTDAFVKATMAEYAVFSVGRRSLFGHPHREVVIRWRDRGATPLMTGIRGTISFVSDGVNLWFTTFKADSATAAESP